MTIPVRSVKRWAPVLLGVRHLQESSKRLHHLETQVSVRPAPGCRSSGQVLWCSDSGGSRVGVAWMWARRLDGLVIIANPMSVASNLALLDDESGDPLSPGRQVCCLNWLICSLPWQGFVAAARDLASTHEKNGVPA